MAHQEQESGNALWPNGVCPSFEASTFNAGRNAAPCLAWVWPAEASQALDARTPIVGELALDRDLLGVTDGSISRADHAPRLTPHAAQRVRLSVPAGSAAPALVLQATDFVSVQRVFPAAATGLCPADLSPSTRVALGTHSSVALLHSERGAEQGRCDYLLHLPRAQRVPPGAEVLVDAPAIIVVGSGAVAIQAGVSVAPSSASRELQAPCSFRLPQAGLTVNAVRRLEAVLHSEDFSTLRLAGHEQPLQQTQLPAVGRTLLTHLQRHFAFLPALVDDREPRLVLLCERQDGSVGAWLGSHDVGAWLLEIERALSGSGQHAKVSRPSAADPLSEPTGIGSVMTFEPEFAAQLQNVRKLVDSSVTILILGESGTGKEHLARAIHANSERTNKPFVPVNCASLPEGLIESELFGHERGAFTGTVAARPGAFVTADGGTLLLDEIGDAPLRVQLALLRVLEDRRVKPVGADHERVVNVRVICATSRDLHELIAKDRFRLDLHYRIAGLSMTLPALRHRARDIPMLAMSVLQGMGHPGTLSADALQYLQTHTWPGNIRELCQALQLAVALSAPGQNISAHHLQAHQGFAPTTTVGGPSGPFPSAVVTLAEQLFRSPVSPPLQANSQYERRAQYRAALLVLCVRYGKAAFPTRLVEQWQQLFGARWASSERERGLRDVCKALGLHPKDAVARAWLLSIVAG